MAASLRRMSVLHSVVRRAVGGLLLAGCSSSSSGTDSDASGGRDSGSIGRDAPSPVADSGHRDATGSHPADALSNDAGALDASTSDANAKEDAGVDSGSTDAHPQDVARDVAVEAGPSECEPTHPTTVPPGAAALNYKTRAFFIQPTLADISYTNATDTDLYSGSYYNAPGPGASYYSMKDGALGMALGGNVATQKTSSEAGKLPYLLGSDGFYVEFATRLSDNNSDHFPAVWILPQEHNLAKSDHLATDPAGYERWMEIDVDEGGYYDGSQSTLISWQGNYDNGGYKSTLWNNNGKLPPLDRTVEHVFGVSYDPTAQLVQFWLDGVATFSHSTSTINSIVNTYHYYLIMDASTHTKKDAGPGVPYEMYVCYASAWTP